MPTERVPTPPTSPKERWGTGTDTLLNEVVHGTTPRDSPALHQQLMAARFRTPTPVQLDDMVRTDAVVQVEHDTSQVEPQVPPAPVLVDSALVFSTPAC